MTDAGAHVLVVDDEPQIVRGLRVILRSAGFEVAQAATKREALDAVAVRPPDVMILDLVLPDGSGVEVCEQVRRGARCRSSCSAPSVTSARRSARSTRAPMTT
jgi:DNA-binding response OmpR family regulator